MPAPAPYRWIPFAREPPGAFQPAPAPPPTRGNPNTIAALPREQLWRIQNRPVARAPMPAPAPFRWIPFAREPPGAFQPAPAPRPTRGNPNTIAALPREQLWRIQNRPVARAPMPAPAPFRWIPFAREPPGAFQPAPAPRPTRGNPDTTAALPREQLWRIQNRPVARAPLPAPAPFRRIPSVRKHPLRTLLGPASPRLPGCPDSGPRRPPEAGWRH